LSFPIGARSAGRTNLAERLGEKRNAAWDNVLNNLSALPQQDGSYVLYEGVPDMWTKYNYEHPA